MSIPTTEKQTKLTNNLLGNIRDLLNSYFIEMGIAIIPPMEVVEIVDKNEMGMQEIVEVVNTTIDRKLYPAGLATRSRKRDLVMMRQIVAYVCRSFGFQYQQIARTMGVNHATTIHGVTTVKNLLEHADPDMVLAYEKIIETLKAYHKDKYGKDLPKIT